MTTPLLTTGTMAPHVPAAVPVGMQPGTCDPAQLLMWMHPRESTSHQFAHATQCRPREPLPPPAMRLACMKPRAFQRTVHRQWHCLTCHLMQCRSTCQGKHHDSGQRRRRLYSHGTYLTVCLVQCIAYRRTPYGDASARERCYNNRDRHRDRGCAPYMGGYVRCTSVMRLVMCTDEW